MPNLLCHTILIKNFLSEINPDGTTFLGSSNLDFLYYGTYGPDPLFYVGILPFNGLHLITALKKQGNKLHKLDGRVFFKTLFDVSNNIQDKDEKNKFDAFIFGQFAHYILDKTAHPYILYKSGFDDKGKISGIYHYNHAHFEADIDILLSKYYKLDNYLINPTFYFKYDLKQTKLIDKYLTITLNEIFNLHNPKNIYSNGLKNYLTLIGFMNKNGKLKSKILGKNQLSALYLDVDNVNNDALNLNKNEYLDPVSGSKENLSFIELLDKAKDEFIQTYEEIKKEGFTFEVLNKHLDNKNYYGTEIDKTWKYQENKIIS